MVVVGGARVDEQQFILKNFFFSSRKPILFVYINTYYVQPRVLNGKTSFFIFVLRSTLYTSSGLMAERIIFHLK